MTGVSRNTNREFTGCDIKCELCHYTNHSTDDCYRILHKREDHRTSDHEMYIASLKRSENYKAQPYQYASSSKQILKAKAKPFPPCTHCGFIDHRPDDCRNYPECEICGSYDHSTSCTIIVIYVEALYTPPLTTMSLITSKERHIREPIWYLDSGCSRSMTGVKSYLHKYVKQPGPKFGDKQGTIFNANKEIVLIAPRRNDVYVLDMSSLTPNGVCFFAKASETERKNKTLIEAARTMLNGLVLSKYFWTKAVIVACYTQNRSIIVKRYDKTPYEIFRERIPDISYFHVFGCPVFIHNHKDHLGKFDAKADNGYFLGYSFISKAFRVFNTKRQQVEETYHKSCPEVIALKSLKYLTPDTKGPRWNKKDEHGTTLKNKARLVTQGYSQEEGIDYDKTFALVARMEAFRIFFAFATYMNFKVYQMDVKSVFLNGKLKEEVYVKQPPGFESSEFPDYFEKLMTKKFEMSMIGELTYFLGLQIKQDDKGISIFQKQYTRNLLKKYEISNSSSVETPMIPPNNLGPDLASKPVNETSYMGMIGSLMYLTATRPDIQFSTFLCARYQSNLKETHLTAVKRILVYLNVLQPLICIIQNVQALILKDIQTRTMLVVIWIEKAPQVPVKYLVENWFVGVPRNSSQWLCLQLKLSMLLLLGVVQVLGENYSSTEQVNFIQQLLAYCLITGTEVDIGEIIYSDLVTKLLNKSRLKYVSYPRFISCALQVLLGSDYTQDENFRFLPGILSNSNFTKDPSKFTDIELMAYIIAGPEVPEALSKKSKWPKSKRPPTMTKVTPPKPTENSGQSHSVSSGTVPDPQDLERDIQLASMRFPSILDEGARKSKPLPESTATHPKDSGGNKQPHDRDITSTTSDEGTAKTTPHPKGSLGDKDSRGNIPPADMEPTQSTRLRYQFLPKNEGKPSHEGELDTQPIVLSTYADVRAFLLSDDESEDDILGSDKPQSSHALSTKTLDTDSFSDDILMKYDNTLPLTERQLVKNLRKMSKALFTKISKDNWEKHKEVAVNYADLKASIDDYYDENIAHQDQTDKLVEASTSSLNKSNNTISDLYKGLNIITELLKEIKMLSRMTLSSTRK
ncbi:retrovirus-related pol polyprotein from transposon TNT 1-94 [Tanacetum coccineum]